MNESAWELSSLIVRYIQQVNNYSVAGILDIEQSPCP